LQRALSCASGGARDGRQLAWLVVFVLLAGSARASSVGRGLGDDGSTRNNNTRVVTDEAGRVVTVPADARRIVSLAPNLTETIYALGIEDRLAGDTEYCDTPAAAKMKPHVGAPLSPSLEAIVALHPDLVLATTSINRRETVDALAHLGIPVYTSDPHTVRGMLDSVERISELAGSAATGTEMVNRLRMRLDALQMRLADRPLVHVLFVVWESPLITIGQNTFIADALRWAGAESVVISRQNWPQIGFEEVVRLAPEYIVLSNHTGAAPVEIERLRSSSGWKELDAVETGHVIVLTDEVLEPSPGLVDAIEQLARDVHPEIFDSQSKMKEPGGEVADRIALSAGRVKECAQCAR
jgi:iron complex transport system substrate-binding protein